MQNKINIFVFAKIFGNVKDNKKNLHIPNFMRIIPEK